MRLKWYTITKLWDRDILCIRGTSNIDALTRAFVAMNMPYNHRDYHAYAARLVNYNITRQCEIL